MKVSSDTFEDFTHFTGNKSLSPARLDENVKKSHFSSFPRQIPCGLHLQAVENEASFVVR